MTTSDELHRIISQKENVRVDFKSEASEDVLRGLSTDIASFANSQGGTIIFGVTDEGDPVGCKLTQTQRDRISQEASKCRSRIPIDTEEVAFGSRQYFLVKIPKSRLVHSDGQHKFPIRIGIITDYLDAPGLIGILQERSILTQEAVEQARKQIAYGRERLSDEERKSLATTLGGSNKVVRIEALRDLAGMPFWFILLEDEALSDAVGRVLVSGEEDEVMLALDFLRGVAHAGTDKEKTVLRGWYPKIEEMAESLRSVEVSRRALDVLQSAKSSRVATLLSRLIENADENNYQGLQLNSLLSNSGSYGLKIPIRKALYQLLEKNSDERTRKRATDALDVLRRTGW